MKKILCFGDICPDLLIPYGAAHLAGSRPSDTRVRFSHGGSAANTASGLGRMGIPVLFAGSAGEDGFGRALRRGLEEDGVDTRYLKLYPELMTMEVLIVVDAQGERTPFAFPQTGASQHHILPEQVPEAILEETGWFHASGITLREDPAAKTQLALMEACKRRGIPVSLDINARMESQKDPFFAGNIRRALGCCTVLFGSEQEELCPLAGEEDPVKAAQMLLEQVPMVVARRGALGADVYTNQGVYSNPVFPVPVADCVGAGDAYNAGFLSALWEGLSPEAANRRGTCCGSFCVSRQGARSCPKREELPAGL